MTLFERQKTFALNISALIKFIFDIGFQCTLGEAERSKEQAEIYAKSGKGIADSLHCKRLAIDLNLFKDGQYLTQFKDYEQAGVFWEKLHPLNRWGGRFTKLVDSNHFEMQDI
jgi:D-alanyl-D-alanine carboxypeptidase